MMVPIDIARAYMARVVKEKGIAPSQVAKLAGLSQTTVTRPLHPNYSKTINLDTLIKIREAHKVPFQPELDVLVRKSGARLRPLAESSIVIRAHKVTDLVANLYAQTPDEKAELFEQILTILSDAPRRA
jgi:transcriptional regulator with XRE-family HTH domain